MRLVLYTNVVFSGLLWRGTAYQLLTAIRQAPDVKLFCSAELVAEFARVLSRPSSIQQLSVIAKTAKDVLSDYATVAAALAGEMNAVSSTLVIRHPENFRRAREIEQHQVGQDQKIDIHAAPPDSRFTEPAGLLSGNSCGRLALYRPETLHRVANAGFC